MALRECLDDAADRDQHTVTSPVAPVRIDVAIISYVLYHYMSNDHCANWLGERLRDGSIGAVLIISRFENLGPQTNAMQVRHVHVTNLQHRWAYIQIWLLLYMRHTYMASHRHGFMSPLPNCAARQGARDQMNSSGPRVGTRRTRDQLDDTAAIQPPAL